MNRPGRSETRRKYLRSMIHLYGKHYSTTCLGGSLLNNLMLLSNKSKTEHETIWRRSRGYWRVGMPDSQSLDPCNSPSQLLEPLYHHHKDHMLKPMSCNSSITVFPNYNVPTCLSRRGGSGVDAWTQSGGLCVGRLRRPGSSWTFPCAHPFFGGTLTTIGRTVVVNQSFCIAIRGYGWFARPGTLDL